MIVCEFKQKKKSLAIKNSQSESEWETCVSCHIMTQIEKKIEKLHKNTYLKIHCTATLLQ